MAFAVMAYLVIDEIERIESIPRRVFRSREDPFGLRDEVFIRLFRLNKDMVIALTDRIKHLLPFEGIKPRLRVLATLRFFAIGGYQKAVADNFCLGLSQTTVSRCIYLVSDAINRALMPEEIKFPEIEEQNTIKPRFFTTCNLPGIIGALDCTHIFVKKPSEKNRSVRAQTYFCKKQKYSINVQLISDDNLIIRAINAKNPGSTEDSGIWEECDVRTQLQKQHEEGNDNSWLVADNNYNIEPWLITEFPDALPGSREEVFNTKLANARSAIKRCKGMLKSRFQCLSKRKILNYEPSQATLIINACAVLHNICMKQNILLELPEEQIEGSSSEGEVEPEPPAPIHPHIHQHSHVHAYSHQHAHPHLHPVHTHPHVQPHILPYGQVYYHDQNNFYNMGHEMVPEEEPEPVQTNTVEETLRSLGQAVRQVLCNNL